MTNHDRVHERRPIQSTVTEFMANDDREFIKVDRVCD